MRNACLYIVLAYKIKSVVSWKAIPHVYNEYTMYVSAWQVVVWRNSWIFTSLSPRSGVQRGHKKHTVLTIDGSKSFLV